MRHPGTQIDLACVDLACSPESNNVVESSSDRNSSLDLDSGIETNLTTRRVISS
jgi:hypothetical protein